MTLDHTVMEALTPLVEAFEQLGIAYYIGGSVSSSVHGVARRTQDVDVIVALQAGQHVHQLVEMLQSEYYLDEQAFQDAMRRGILYGVLHLTTMMKVDLIPLKQRPFSQEEARRAQPTLLEPGTRLLRVASAEDAILTKLEWFEMGGQTSTRQWNDILGIMRQQGDNLDRPYMRQWADVLRVRELLEDALAEVGLQQG